MWPRDPSHSRFGAAFYVVTPQLFPEALCQGHGTPACLGSPPLAPGQSAMAAAIVPVGQCLLLSRCVRD